MRFVEGKKPNFVCIDIGSHKIATLAASISSQIDADVIDYGVYSSEGIKAGVVVDFQKAEDALGNAIYGLERNIGQHVESAIVVLSGAQAQSRYLNQSVGIASETISKEEVDMLMTKAVRSAGATDKSVLHCFPVEFFVDGQGSIKNPVGMAGSKLSANLHAITADASSVLNLGNCFSKYQVSVDEFVSAPVASGFAALDEQLQDSGPIVIDCGATTTSFAVFSKGVPVFCDYVPFGGWHVTNDIAQVLSINFSSAERLKVLYADLNENAQARTFEVNLGDQDRRVDSLLLNEVATSRVGEILSLVRDKIDRLDSDLLQGQNIVLTGGASNMSGIESLCSTIFKVSRIKEFSRHHGGVLSGDSSLYSYAAVLGMLSYRMKHYSNYYFPTAAFGPKLKLWKRMLNSIKSYFK